MTFKFLEITKAEREKARKKYEPEIEVVKERMAFGRRANGPPRKVYSPPPSGTFDSFGFGQGIWYTYMPFYIQRTA